MVLKFQRILLLFAPSVLVCSISIHVIVEKIEGLNIWVKLKLRMEEQILSRGKGILPESGSKNSVSCANSGCNCTVTEIYVVSVFCRYFNI